MMEEEKGSGDSLRASSSFLKAGDRQMFTVELRPGETTIVSWKKLMKDANKVNGPSTSAPEPPANAHPRLESRIAPVQPDGDEVKDGPATNRFSAVIEKIERLYMGKDSSDDEDLNDIPDDDQYDTEDSFIDDAELDEYFQVDNSAIKHDGFFVNRGKLERIEPAALPNQQPKKRRRKDLAKGNGENDDGHLPNNKHAKLSKMAAAKVTSNLTKSSSTPSQPVAVAGEHFEDVKLQNQFNASDGSKKKSSDSKTMLDPTFLKVSNGDASVPLPEGKDFDKQKTGVLLSKDSSSKLKDVGADGSHLKYHEKSAYSQSRPQSGRPLGNVDELDSSVRAREKNGIREPLDLNTFEGKYSIPTMRNLKVMISMGLSAKQEKDDRFQHIKKEVVEMIKLRTPLLESKALEQQAGASDDFQEVSAEDKETSKKKFSMDAALEDKICDLYDLYVDGLDEDAGPQIRKLYAELAGLWPHGFMDNHGIKRAICRAKERRRTLYNRNKEKIRRKKVLPPTTEDTVRVTANSIIQPQYTGERLATESGTHSSANKPVSSAGAAVRMPSPINAPSFDRLKQEKLKGSSSNPMDHVRVGDGTLPKKKVKRKPEVESDETRVRAEKLPPQQGEERQKSLKQAASIPHKSNLQSNVLPSVEQSS